MTGEIVFWTYFIGWAITGLTPAALAARGQWSSDDHWQFVVLGALWPLLIVAVPFALAEEWHQRQAERKETGDG